MVAHSGQKNVFVHCIFAKNGDFSENF